MKTLGRLDGFLGGHMAPVVLCCVALGIAFPEVLSHLNGVTVGLFAFMTFSNSLGGGFRELAQVVRHPLPVAVIFGLLHVVMPLITLGLGTLCFPDAPLFTIGLVLEYAVPTGVASLMWVGMSRGNTALCLSVVLLDTLLSPVVIPLTMKLLVEHGLTERHARCLLRLEDEGERLTALRQAAAKHWNVAQTEQYVERRLAALQTAPPAGRRTYIIKDVRLFLNSVDRGLRLIRDAGVDARTEREETEDEIVLTLRIPKQRRKEA